MPERGRENIWLDCCVRQAEKVICGINSMLNANAIKKADREGERHREEQRERERDKPRLEVKRKRSLPNSFETGSDCGQKEKQ